jgi:membrane associated rhomboid family serine protease
MVPASVGFHCPGCTDSHPGRKVRNPLAPVDPIATKVLIGLNAAAFVLMVITSGDPARAMQSGGGTMVANYGLIGYPAGVVPGLPFGVTGGEWWRLVTGGFLHAGLVHLGFNMLVLWLLGSQLERALGRARFVALYVASLLAGAFGVMLVDPTAMTVGASGAIFGLMGAAVAMQRASGVSWWNSGLGTLLVVNLLLTFTIPNISVGGHLGGLVGGLVTGAAMVAVDRNLRSTVASLGVAAALSAVFVAGSLWAAANWDQPLLGFIG